MKDEEREEWDMPPRGETLPIAPEDHHRFGGLMTELFFSAAGACILGFSASLIHDPKPVYVWPRPPRPFWDQVIYEWLPPFMLLLAFACLVWLITIPVRLANLKRTDSSK